jgi:hypothetical protein
LGVIQDQVVATLWGVVERGVVLAEVGVSLTWAFRLPVTLQLLIVITLDRYLR